MSTASDINKIVETLETLKKKKIGQYQENVVELCTEEYGWTEAAKKHSISKEVASSNNKKSYRVTNQNVVKIQQNDQPLCLGFNNNDADDFVEFKKFIHSEILSLKAQVTHKIQSPVREQEPGQETDYMKDLIRSLQDRIVSLERQLQQKQWIIEKLLDGPKENVNKQEQQLYPQTHNCTPRAQREVVVLQMEVKETMNLR